MKWATIFLTILLASLGETSKNCRKFQSCLQQGKFEDYLVTGAQGPKGDPGVCTCSIKEERIQALENRLHMITLNSCGVGARYGGSLTDESFTARSYHNDSYYPSWNTPAQGRLDKLVEGKTWGGWLMSYPYNIGDWLQVDMQQTHTITGIVTQGGGDTTYVTSYFIQFGTTTSDLEFIHNEDGVAKRFRGNKNGADYHFNIFVKPVSARLIRIIPLGYNIEPFLRVEFLTC